MVRGSRRAKSRVGQSHGAGAGSRGKGRFKSGSGSTSSRRPRSSAQAKHKPGTKTSKLSKKRQASTRRVQPGAEYAAALKHFETALGYFRKQNYQKASAFFEKVLESPAREIAERARMHLRICEQKTRQQAPPRTADESYLRGVAALNSRDLEHAIQYLSRSDKMAPNQAHVHYALAAAYGLQGEGDTSLSHLQKAIELQPRNRIQARLDDDFQLLEGDPRFERLIGLRAS